MGKTAPSTSTLKPKRPSPMQPEMRPVTLKNFWRVLLRRQDIH